MKNRTPARLLLPLALSLLAGCAPLMSLRGGPPVTALAGDLDRVIESRGPGAGHWGVIVRSLDSGETVYARNSDLSFTPASNAKLVTGATILETLGPEYTYSTTIATSGQIRDGVLDGSLVVTGTGDPTISERFLGDSRAVFRAWADSLRAYGVTRIAGGIVAVDTAFAGPTLGEGWMWDDLLTADSAPFGALQFNEGTVGVNLYPSGTILQPALVVLSPPTQAVRVINATRTMSAGSIPAIRVVRDENGDGVVITGEVPEDVNEMRRTVAVSNPTLYFVTVLRETLREAGIVVEGAATLESELLPFDPTVREAMTLFTHRSPSLREILPGMLKPSQNQIAEAMLLTVGRELRGVSTAVSGAAVADSLLRAREIDPSGLRLADGSGLSRYSLVSPSLLVDLLTTMDGSRYRDVWHASLPVAGRDGTLAGRMTEGPLTGQVVAKTGTLRGTRSLSGYLTSRSGERYAFSILVNNHFLPGAEIDALVEGVLERIAQIP